MHILINMAHLMLFEAYLSYKQAAFVLKSTFNCNRCVWIFSRVKWNYF